MNRSLAQRFRSAFLFYWGLRRIRQKDRVEAEDQGWMDGDDVTSLIIRVLKVLRCYDLLTRR